MRDLSELIAAEEPAWPRLAEMIDRSPVDVQVLQGVRGEAESTLLQLQVTTRSWLGAVIMSTGGLVADHGWLRIYGGSPAPSGLPGLAQVNGFPAMAATDWQPPCGLVIAHDVLGGAYALNLADPAAWGRPGEPGEVVYFAPDSMAWEPLGAGHGAWLSWILSGGLEQFYQNLRWPGWEAESVALALDQGISVYPFLWSAEAHEDLADARFLAESYARQLGPDHPDKLHWQHLTAMALWDAGRHDEATAEMADVAARRAATQGAAHPDTLQAERILSAMTSDVNARFGFRPSTD